MPCCVIYHNSYSSRDIWPNYEAINYCLCGSMEIRGEFGDRDKRLFKEAIGILNRQQTTNCIIATLMTFSVYFAICGFPWMLAVCNENTKLQRDVEKKLVREQRQYGSCILCSITWCFAMEYKPEEEDDFQSTHRIRSEESDDFELTHRANSLKTAAIPPPVPEPSGYDIFISYRVSTDEATATMLYLMLQRRKVSVQGSESQRDLKVFFDKKSLEVGEDWEVGFLNALQNSRMVLFVISEGGLKGVESADQHQDNVLLEYELAMKLMKEKGLRVLPLLVQNKETTNKGKVAYCPFDKFSVDPYPNEKHCAEHSPKEKTIKETMHAIFQLQGTQLPPGEQQHLWDGVIEAIVNRLST